VEDPLSNDPAGADEPGRIDLPELLWHGGGVTPIRLPETWRVEVHALRGARRPPITGDDVARALAAPIGTPPLRDLARGRRKAVVLFDDLTRPTRADAIAPLVVDALLDGGIAPDKISFVCALGAHAPLPMRDLRKKLGDGIVERFRVYNHDARDHCVSAGTTSRGTKLWINREVMSADLKIGIGGVLPHPNAGFSGGGKVVLPGVARLDTIVGHHVGLLERVRETTGFGRFDANDLRLDIEEAARIVGLDFKVDVLFNGDAAACAVFAGEFAAVHREAVAAARKINTMKRGSKKDVVIVNALAKPNEIVVAFRVGQGALLPRLTGTIVIVANAPDGQVVHHLLGRWGEAYGGPKHPSVSVVEGIRLVVQAPTFDRTMGDWFGNPEVITFTRDWAGTLAALQRWHGPGTEVAVLPSGDLGWYPA